MLSLIPWHIFTTITSALSKTLLVIGLSPFTQSIKLKDKCVYLVGRYDAGSNESLSDICRKHNIDREDIMCIPYNIAFHDAIVEGRLVPFMSKNMLARRFDDNFDFINNVYRATHMILKKAGYDETKE